MLDEETRKHVYNFTPYSKSLDYTVALCSLAHMVVGTDSALMHLAAAQDTKLFGLYGPFPGEIRLSTYSYADWIDVEDTCAPCFIHSETNCKFGKSKCYNNLDFEEAIQRINDLYNMEKE